MPRPALRSLVVLGIVCVTLGAAGCGGSGGDGASGGDAERGSSTGARAARGACALLPERAVRAAVGEPVVAGTQSTDECWWSTANDLKTVNLIRRHDDLTTWRQGYANDFWVPNDLGDEGYSGKALDSVVWRVGDTQYELNVVYSTKGDPARVVQTLAQQAAARR